MVICRDKLRSGDLLTRSHLLAPGRTIITRVPSVTHQLLATSALVSTKTAPPKLTLSPRVQRNEVIVLTRWILSIMTVKTSEMRIMRHAYEETGAHASQCKEEESSGTGCGDGVGERASIGDCHATRRSPVNGYHLNGLCASALCRQTVELRRGSFLSYAGRFSVTGENPTVNKRAC